jgi:hypothetical protein
MICQKKDTMNCAGKAAGRLVRNGYSAMGRQEQVLRAGVIEFRGDFG